MALQIFKTLAIIALGWSLILGLFLLIPFVHDWERRAGYPFGKMCEPNIFNLYQGSCR